MGVSDTVIGVHYWYAIDSMYLYADMNGLFHDVNLQTYHYEISQDSHLISGQHYSSDNMGCLVIGVSGQSCGWAFCQ